MGAAPRRLSVLASVRCLECGEVYSRPAAGGTVQENPGCPDCGYVGWMPLGLPSGRRGLSRFVEDLRPRLTARSR